MLVTDYVTPPLADELRARRVAFDELGLIFGKAQNKFQDPAKLRRVIVDLIDTEN